VPAEYPRAEADPVAAPAVSAETARAQAAEAAEQASRAAADASLADPAGGTDFDVLGRRSGVKSWFKNASVARARIRRPRGSTTSLGVLVPASLFTGRIATTGILGPSIVKYEGKLPQAQWPGGKRYGAYMTTNHDDVVDVDGVSGGVWLALADQLSGPWTAYQAGRIYVDGPGSEFETETFEVVWNPLTRQFHGYYQNAGVNTAVDGSTIRGAQSTLLAVSTDGVNWTRHGPVVFRTDVTNRPGNGHTGYLKPFLHTERDWIGTSLQAGGGMGFNALWRSKDGVLWVPDPRLMHGPSRIRNNGAVPASFSGFNTAAHAHFRDGLPVEFFHVGGRLFATAQTGRSSTSGGDAATDVVVSLGEVYEHDPRRWKGEREIIWQPTGAGEESNIQHRGVYIDPDSGDFLLTLALGLDVFGFTGSVT
jgi:hypothetical protein